MLVFESEHSGAGLAGAKRAGFFTAVVFDSSAAFISLGVGCCAFAETAKHIQAMRDAQNSIQQGFVTTTNLR